MELSRMNLNLLVPLATLLQTRNVTRAGEQLNLSQSSMSAILARLRTAFDDPLLVKTGREMTLTPYAESLIEPVQQILTDIERVVTHRPGFDPSIDGRTFTVVASDYSTLFLLRPLLEQLEAEAPNVTLEVHPLLDDYADRIKHDDADLLVVSEQLAAEFLPEYPRRTMFRDRFVVAAWKGNEALTDDTTLEDFALMRFAQYVTGQRLNLADKALDDLGVVRQVEVRTASQLLVPFLLTRTPLVALIPERLARATREPAELRYIDPPVPLPVISDACLWHPRRTGDPGHQWFIRRLSDLASSL
ncbi:LysR substrate-binding domain-containing protein [Kribbella sp. NPDC050124]|uniref:LysR family transcriptional regulator n=1 Tax=Kribbella sp. NPDC050124 TaxID=3364114 RepID=UPI0037996724